MANKDEHLHETSRRLQVMNESAWLTSHETGVRLCPWDEEYLLIPFLDRGTGEIAGDGKKYIGRRRVKESYTKVGEKEWLGFTDLVDIFGEEKARQMVANKHFKSEERNGSTVYEVTECMLALSFFPTPPPLLGRRWQKWQCFVGQDALNIFLHQIQQDSSDITVYAEKQ